jgi:hypothetical protein
MAANVTYVFHDRLHASQVDYYLSFMKQLVRLKRCMLRHPGYNPQPLAHESRVPAALEYRPGKDQRMTGMGNYHSLLRPARLCIYLPFWEGRGVFFSAIRNDYMGFTIQ